MYDLDKILGSLPQFLESRKLLAGHHQLQWSFFVPLLILQLLLISFTSYLTSAFSDHSLPKLFIHFRNPSLEGCANEQWSFNAISLLNLFLVVQSTMRLCSLLLFTSSRNCFAGVSGNGMSHLKLCSKIFQFLEN